MKVSKVARSNARRIFGICQTDGRFDEEKLRAACRRLHQNRPRDYRGILIALKRLVRLELERRKVLVESAAALDEATQQRVRDDLTAKHGGDLDFEFRTNPDLLGGLRIRVGSDVWDGSVKGRLDRLAQAF